jgi:acetolactate synthase regulatory subunit
MVEYKVLSERDSRIAGRFDPDALERVLNDHAQKGWRVVQGFTATSVWKSLKTEIVVILDRDVSGAT